MSDEKSLGELAHAAWWDFWQDDSARQDWDELDQFEQSAWQDAAVAAFPPGAVAVEAGYLAALVKAGHQLEAALMGWTGRWPEHADLGDATALAEWRAALAAVGQAGPGGTE